MAMNSISILAYWQDYRDWILIYFDISLSDSDWILSPVISALQDIIFLPIFSPYFLPIFSTIWLWLDPVISYLNNESVSWVRRSDSHIIAVDREVFISDQRFISSIQKLSNLWILKVNQQQISISNYQIPIFWIFE